MGKLKKASAALALCLWVAGPAYSFCFEEAGEMYKINPQILRAIAKVESNFNPTALNRNTNGTYDVGLMQINSGWAATLGQERWKQLGDACYNAKTGAWILSQCIDKYGYNWKAIGCYHSQTPDKRDHYAQMVFNQLQKVAPLPQEAAYAPLKNQLAGLVQQEVESLVAQDVKKHLAQADPAAVHGVQHEQPREPEVQLTQEQQPLDAPAQDPQVQEQPQEAQPQEAQPQPPEEQPQPQVEQQVEPQVQPPEQPQEAPPQEIGEPAPVTDAPDPQ